MHQAQQRLQLQHSYAGYSGPWIENEWISHFGNKPFLTFYPLVPLFLQITDLCVGANTSGLVNLFKRHLRADVLYITVVQHDAGLCFLPPEAGLCGARNVLVWRARHRQGSTFRRGACTSRFSQ